MEPPKYIPIIPYIDRNGVETVETPEHVFKHNKIIDPSPVTLTECPKGNRGSVCSGNGICRNITSRHRRSQQKTW